MHHTRFRTSRNTAHIVTMKYEHAAIQTEDGGGGDDDNDSRSSEYAEESSTVPNPADDGGVPHRRLASLDGGIHSGVPTRTTATLTPTTLRNIEQTFFELTNEPPASVPCQAGFVAPLPSFQFETQPQQHHQQQQQQQHQLHGHQDLSFHAQQQQQQQQQQPTTTTAHLLQQQPPQHHHQQLHQLQLPQQHQQQHPVASQLGAEENSLDSEFGSESSNSSSWTSPPPTLADDSLVGNNTNTSTPSGRKMGGRRPKNASNLTPAEEEKRKVRRERNKLAAARCRKRRVDQTNELLEKVAVLEKEKHKLQADMQKLQAESEQLTFYLQDHSGQCRLMTGGVQKMEFKQPLHQQQQQQHSNFLQQHHQQQQQLPSGDIATATATTTGTTTTTTTNNNNSINNNGTVLVPRPMLLPLNKIKVEHIKIEPHDSNSLDDSIDDSADDLLHAPPSAKRIMLSSHHNPIIASSGIIGCDTPTTLNTPNILPPYTTAGGGQRPNRPSSLAVPFAITPSQCKNIADMAGVSITTPSNGVMFNFDSLMDGGTGLTPVSQPLVPSYPTSSSASGGGGVLGGRNNGASGAGAGMDLVTPTSEPSKLVSL